ncbi:MAG: acetaldehyde dehydrogenase [Sphingomonas bacterium]|jgi:acetaldehyde dehydrogenase|nr:acetaldehyde dehydrogenase [Sphingomonas bacterium]
MKTKVAIIGSGNIGTDLMIKVLRLSDVLEMGAFVGIDPGSDGLTRAARMGVPITAGGIEGLVAMPGFADIAIVFDATSAGAHKRHSEILLAHGKSPRRRSGPIRSPRSTAMPTSMRPTSTW